MPESSETYLLLEAQDLVDRGLAAWVHVGQKVRRCHLCRAPLGAVVVKRNDLYWCLDVEACKRRAARRLGVRAPGAEPRPKRGDAWALDELLGVLARARRERADWYVWVLDRAQQRREA